jgi:dynactin complex subunit
MQIREGKEDGYKGILRFLGEIQGKGAVVFAGLELIDEWQGLGKNDGTVGA